MAGDPRYRGENRDGERWSGEGYVAGTGPLLLFSIHHTVLAARLVANPVSHVSNFRFPCLDHVVAAKSTAT